MSRRVPMRSKVREVHPGIFLLHLPLPMKPTIVNVYLVRGGDEWGLVDTGVNSADSIATFRSVLDEVGCAPERIRTIVCTHHHPDHFGTSKTYKELTGAKVLLHRAEEERVESFAPRKRSRAMIDFFLRNGIPLRRFGNVPRQSDFWAGLYVPAKPDAHIDDGDVLRVGDVEIRVVWTPGHAPGHCVLYLPSPKIMIVGDHLLPKITPHVGYAPGSVDDPLGDFLDSQRKVQQLDVELVLPAHGGVFADARHRARQIIQHHEHRLREMVDALRLGPRHAYDVARCVFAFDWDSPLSYQFPATFETLAHLEHLRHRGTVVHEERDGKLLYRIA